MASSTALSSQRSRRTGATGPFYCHRYGLSGAMEGFNVVVGMTDAKARHLRRDPRASLVVYQNQPPYKGIEITTDSVLSEDGALEVERRLAHRHLGPVAAEDYLTSSDWEPLLIRLDPGELRVWDFADK